MMVIDVTAQLAPIMWGMLAALLVSAAAITGMAVWPILPFPPRPLRLTVAAGAIGALAVLVLAVFIGRAVAS